MSSRIDSPKPQTLWQDSDLLVVSKPVGLLVDSGGRESDLIEWARGEGFRGAFAFHRLDRGTSGLVLLGLSRKYAREMTEMFETKRIRKSYLAVVEGEWPSTLNRVDSPIENKDSLTTFRRLATSPTRSLLECLPKTGRTHQIRIHCASQGHAICGDTKYSSSADSVAPTTSTEGHALHAFRLSFRHPADGREVTVRSEPREWLTSWLKDFEIEAVWSKLFADREDSR